MSLIYKPKKYGFPYVSPLKWERRWMLKSKKWQLIGMRYKSLVKGSQETLTILQVDLLLHSLQTQFQFTIFSSQTISISLLREKKKKKNTR